MTDIRIICGFDEVIQSGVIGNVKKSSDLIPLVFYFMGLGLEKRRLTYFDDIFKDWIDFDSTVELKELPNPLKMKVVDVSDGSFYEGKDYETLRRENEEKSDDDEDLEKKAEVLESIEKIDLEDENGFETVSPSEIMDVPFSPDASIDEDTFEGIDFFDENQIQFESLDGIGLE